jgi:aspartyl-tRNA(Asn)/glutamyl-tRNA(Gln) amidotransferase subunit A
MADAAVSARAIAAAVVARAASARDLVAEALARVAGRDGELQAFTDVDEGLALAAAAAVDRRVAARERPFLAGVPVGVKELIAVAGLAQGYGTAALPTRRAAADAACVERLRAAGAIPLGTTRSSELGWRDDTPPTRNPVDPTLSCGGSSGGSGAAVAAGLVPLALGTDTGGSVRCPAALCGCCGLKPTLGAVSLDGVLPVSPSLDHVGPLGACVDDLALAHAALTGGAPPSPGPADVAGLRLGLAQDAVDGTTAAAVAEVAAGLAARGAALVPVELPSPEAADAVIGPLSLLDGVTLFGAADLTALSAASRAELASAAALTADDLAGAERRRRELRAGLARLLAAHGLHAVVRAATPGPVPRRGDPRPTPRIGALLGLANVTGQPSCVVPLRRGPAPLAVQLLGRRGRDGELLALAAAVEALA